MVPRGAENGAVLSAGHELQIAPECTQNGDETVETAYLENAR